MCWNGNPWFGRENAEVLQFTLRDHNVGETCTQLKSSTRPNVPLVLHLWMSKSLFFFRFFSFLSHFVHLCTTCVNSIVMAVVSREFWNFQTNHNRQPRLLSLPRRHGQSAEKWEWGLEFNYSLKALRVQYESEGWDINLQGCLCLYGGYKKKIIQNLLRWHLSLENSSLKFDGWTTRVQKTDMVVHSFSTAFFN